MGTAKPRGNHPSNTLNTMSATRASQKVGVEASRKQYPFTARSSAPPWRMPAATPSVTPRTPLSTQAQAMSASELAARVPMTSMTGALNRSDVPRSPCRAPASQLA